MKPLGCALLVLPLCLAVTAGGAEDKSSETPWFPLHKGDTWHYRAGDSKFQMRVAGEENGLWRIDMVKDGKVGASEFIRVSADGVYRIRVEAPRGDRKFEETPKPPVLLLRLPPRKGETFTVDSRAEPSGKVYRGSFKIGEEKFTVGDKEYNCVVVTGQDLEGDGLKPNLTTWYAENVGMVKQIISVADQKVDIELEKFEKAP